MGLLYAVDWVDVLDLDGISYYYGLDWIMKNHLSLLDTASMKQMEMKLNFYVTHIKLSDIHCGEEAEKFDRDCSYNATTVSLKTTAAYIHPLIILSCNPRPGKSLKVLKGKEVLSPRFICVIIRREK